MARKKQNNSKWLWIGIPVAIVLIVFLWIGGSYNSLVSLEEETDRAWGNVETAYQRRADLIPNIVATVQQYTDYEGPLLKEITQARASVGRAQNPEQLAAAGGQMNSALSRLLVVAENYPNLKANENFLDLQVQLERTENRIKVERDNYNTAVRNLNVKVRRFPTNMLANMFGFDQREYFESEEGAEAAPEVGELFE